MAKTTKSQRSRIAKRGWETRRRKERARSLASARGWITRRRTERKREAERERRSFAAKKAWQSRVRREAERRRKISEGVKRARRAKEAREKKPELVFEPPIEAFLHRGDPHTRQIYKFVKPCREVTVTVEFDEFQIGDKYAVQTIGENIGYELLSDVNEDEFRRIHNDAIRGWLESIRGKESPPGSIWLLRVVC